jgi:mono/diheme cytochrome c family protein
MRKTLLVLSSLLTCGFAIYLVGCSDSKNEKEEATPEATTMSKEDMIKRGDYIVTTGVCNDCHSPKVFTPQGEPLPDSTKLLSGHQAGSQLPPLETKSLKPGNWISMSPDLTTFIGPWGVSYAANLTPDSATGIGAWNETTFINTLRSGKHLGNGRNILPPMPWQFISKLTDDDLKSVFAYLQSLPAVNNRVPAPLSPPEAAKMTEAVK